MGRTAHLWNPQEDISRAESALGRPRCHKPAQLDTPRLRDRHALQTEGVKVPVRHRLATEEDLAKLPTLLIGFGKRLTPEQILENDEDEHEEEE
jgi:hypothetical protein